MTEKLSAKKCSICGKYFYFDNQMARHIGECCRRHSLKAIWSKSHVMPVKPIRLEAKPRRKPRKPKPKITARQIDKMADRVLEDLD